MQGNIRIGLLLATVAGLSTTVGSLLGIAVRKPGRRFMGFTLGFSAGVMILISFVVLLPNAMNNIGFVWGHVAFFLGMVGIFLIDVLVPHEYIAERISPHKGSKAGLKRTAVLVACGIAIHNFPEGIAVLAGALKEPKLGLAIALAIAVHNIPEGLAISAPIYLATGSRRKAFLWSFLSGVSEPIGALLAGLFLMPFLTDYSLSLVQAVVAGIMVAIALDELMPAAKAYGSEHMPITGVIAGMAVMALSLWMMG